MTIEKLSDFLKNTPKRDTLRRIYTASQLQKEIEKLTPDPLTVILRKETVVVNCVNQSQAKYLTNNLRKIHIILTKLQINDHKIKIQVR